VKSEPRQPFVITRARELSFSADGGGAEGPLLHRPVAHAVQSSHENSFSPKKTSSRARSLQARRSIRCPKHSALKTAKSPSRLTSFRLSLQICCHRHCGRRARAQSPRRRPRRRRRPWCHHSRRRPTAALLTDARPRRPGGALPTTPSPGSRPFRARDKGTRGCKCIAHCGRCVCFDDVHIFTARPSSARQARRRGSARTSSS